MKKIVCLLFISVSIFLFGCNTKNLQEELDIQNNNIENIEDKEETIKTPIRKTETDEEKQKILDILYDEPIERIRQYFYEDVFNIEFRELDFPDDVKETIATSFFQKYFSDDVEMQNKLSQLSADYKYEIYKYLKDNKRIDEVLDILYNEPIERIRQYFYEDVFNIEFRELDFPDDVKETIATSFFQKYFSDDVEMQNKLSQLSPDYKYEIYKYLK